MQDIVKMVALYVGYFAEIAAALVIVVGALQAIWTYLRWAFSSRAHSKELTRSRLKLGQSLSLGLGFLVGADIIKTAVAPTWNDIGILAAIITIRTVLNIFLARDIKMIEKTSED